MAMANKHDEMKLLAFDMVPTGIVLAENRVIITCNDAFAEMFGYEREALIGRSLAILYPTHEEFVRIGDVGVVSLRQTGRYSDERIMARADGTMFWCRARGRTLTKDGDPLEMAVWSFADLSSDRPVIGLTTRERQVVMHLGEGLTSKEIARLIGISPRTVEAYRARLLKKFNAGNVAELLGKLGGTPNIG